MDAHARSPSGRQADLSRVVAGEPNVSSRDEDLGRIRSALRDVAPSEAPEDVEVPRRYRVAGDGSDPVEAFAARVEEYRAEVHRVDAGAVASAVGLICEAAEVRRLVVPPGVPQEWLPEDGVEVVTDEDLTPA